MNTTDKIQALIALRGQHDQTVRTKIVSILYGTETVAGVTPTERFLEDTIARLVREEAR